MLLVLFLVSFPVLIMSVFYRLVTKHHTKLYAPSDFLDGRILQFWTGDKSISYSKLVYFYDEKVLYKIFEIENRHKKN